MWIGLTAILVLIVVTGFFVASEFSLVTVRKTRIEQLISEGRAAASDVKHAVEHLERYIAAVQIGITMCALGLGALGEPVLADVIGPWLAPLMSPIETVVSAHGIAIALSFLIVTVVEIVLGEVVPKMIARQKTVGTALFVIRPLNIFVFFFRPLVWVINALSNAVLRLFGMTLANENASVYSVEELEMIVHTSREAGVLDQTEEVILRRVFDFGDLTARQVMRPRTELAAIPLDASFHDVMEAFVEQKHSRFPVYEGDLDHIRGVLHVRDVLSYLAGRSLGAEEPAREGQRGRAPADSRHGRALVLPGPDFKVASLMRPVQAVPETLDVGEVLNRMQKSSVQMVVVVDEYGGTSGVVTLEDILEEIVGELHDEFEPAGSPSGIVTTPEGVLIDGLVPIDDVNDTLGLNIESEADTLGGYVFEVLGRKPELGDEIPLDGQVARVEALDGLRIARVRLVPAAHTPSTGAFSEENEGENQ